LAFAASLLTFSRCRVGLQGLSRARFVRTIGMIWTQPLAFASSSERLNAPGGRPKTHPPLMGFVRLVPHRRRVRPASTPTRHCCLASYRPLPHGRSRSALVVSHHLDGLLRGPGCGSCDPLPAGVRHVLREIQSHRCRSTDRPENRDPRDAAPFEEYPSSIAATASLQLRTLMPLLSLS
jgi:hypothetical protein